MPTKHCLVAFLTRTGRGDCVWLCLTETYQVKLGSGAEDSIPGPDTSGVEQLMRDTGRCAPGTPKRAVLLRREAREEMGQQQADKGRRAEA